MLKPGTSKRSNLCFVDAVDSLWTRLYPGKIGGIFFDEIWNGTTVVDAATYADYYRMLSDNTKRKHPGAFTVLNPGQAVEQSFEDRSVIPTLLVLHDL